jgi:hypothetical protein
VDLQLAAQALCLEEMTGRAVPEGALYYASSRRRRVVAIDDALRQRVRDTARDVTAMLTTGHLPPPTADRRRCTACSRLERCQADALDRVAHECEQARTAQPSPGLRVSLTSSIAVQCLRMRPQPTTMAAQRQLGQPQRTPRRAAHSDFKHRQLCAARFEASTAHSTA